MREYLLAPLTVVLVGQALAFAPQNGSHSVGQRRPEAQTWSPPAPPPANAPGDWDQLLSPEGLSEITPAHSAAQPRVKEFGFRGSVEYLLWWFKNGRIPPLVTAGGNGRLGSPGTRVLVDNLDFANGVRQGARFALAYHLESIPWFSVEASYFFLADKQADARFSSASTPSLAQPFIDALTGINDATVVAEPGLATGTVIIGARTSLRGAETNLAARVISSDRFHLTTIGGFRFLQLEDEVTSNEQFLVSPNVPGFGGSRVDLHDEFRTRDSFFGGQIGLEAGLRRSSLEIDVLGKVALGRMQQVARVRGATNSRSPDGSMSSFEGGLYALRSNSGRHQRDELAFIPEAGLKVGFQLTRHLKVSAGYSWIWVSTVTRAGVQIDPVVNVSQFPIRSGNGPLLGPSRPAFNFDRSTFWAQGLKFGLEVRY